MYISIHTLYTYLSLSIYIYIYIYMERERYTVTRTRAKPGQDMEELGPQVRKRFAAKYCLYMCCMRVSLCPGSPYFPTSFAK